MHKIKRISQTEKTDIFYCAFKVLICTLTLCSPKRPCCRLLFYCHTIEAKDPNG